MKLPELVLMMAAAAGIATVSAVYFGTLTVAAALDIGMILACLTWLFFLVRIPWDLYFAARRARMDGQESQRLGIEGVRGQTLQLARMEQYLLLGALGGHAVTAAAVFGLSLLRPELVRPDFSLLFVASVALRPAWEGYGYLRHRLAELTEQVRYPREDVTTLKGRVETMRLRCDELARDLQQVQVEGQTRMAALEAALAQAQSQQIAESARLERRTVQLSHRFEEVVTSISSDQDLLAGVRAFARMLREPTTSVGGA